MNEEKQLDCGHPIGCADDDGDCLWCDEVAGLNVDVKALTEVIELKAVIVEDGGKLTVGGPIGYLKVCGGIVTTEMPCPITTLT